MRVPRTSIEKKKKKKKKKKTDLREISLAGVLHAWSEMGKQNLHATKVYYRCLYIEKE